MSVDEIDWSDPEAIEGILRDDWCWLLDIDNHWENSPNLDVINIMGYNIDFIIREDWLYAYSGDTLVWIVKCIKEDKYIDFIGTINWITDIHKSEWIKISFNEYFPENTSLKIKWLGYNLLKYFFKYACTKGDTIKMHIMNEKIRCILLKLKDEGIIYDFWDIQGVPNETEVLV